MTARYLAAAIYAGLPVMARAQSVTLRDLAGVWTRETSRPSVTPLEMDGKVITGLTAVVVSHDTLYLQPDSTFRWGGSDASTSLRHPQRWNYLHGDTLSFTANGSCASSPGGATKECASCPSMGATSDKNGHRRPDECVRGEPGFKVAVEGARLTLTALGDTDMWEAGTYTRLEVPRQTP